MVDALFTQGVPVLTEEELSVLESVGQVLQRPAGHIFMSQGEETDFALLMRKGHVKVVVGEPPRIVAIRGPGEIVGEMAAIRHKPRSGSVIALDDVEALHLSGEVWLRFLYEHPRAMHAQLVATHAQLDQATRKIAESELAVERRLAKALVELVVSGLGKPGQGGVTLRFSQQDLANLIGASLDSVKKIIRTLKAGRLIATGRQYVVIRDIKALSEIADGTRTAMQ